MNFQRIKKGNRYNLAPFFLVYGQSDPDKNIRSIERWREVEVQRIANSEIKKEREKNTDDTGENGFYSGYSMQKGYTCIAGSSCCNRVCVQTSATNKHSSQKVFSILRFALKTGVGLCLVCFLCILLSKYMPKYYMVSIPAFSIWLYSTCLLVQYGHECLTCWFLIFWKLDFEESFSKYPQSL